MAIIHKKVFNPPPSRASSSFFFYPWFLCIILSPFASFPSHHPSSPYSIPHPLASFLPLPLHHGHFSPCIIPFPLHHPLPLKSFPNCIIISPFIIQLPLRSLPLPLASSYFPLHHSPPSSPCIINTFPCITLPPLPLHHLSTWRTCFGKPGLRINESSCVKNTELAKKLNLTQWMTLIFMKIMIMNQNYLKI